MIGAGLTECTRTPLPRSSRRRPSTSPCTANLLDEYTVAGGTDAHAATDEIITMSPSPRARMPGSTSRVRSATATTLVA